MVKLGDWVCPICGLGIPVTFSGPTVTSPPLLQAVPDDGSRCVGTLRFDIDSTPLYEHLATHKPRGREPIAA